MGGKTVKLIGLWIFSPAILFIEMGNAYHSSGEIMRVIK